MAKRENGSGSIVRRRYAHGTAYVAYAPATYCLNEQGKPRRIYTKLGSFSTRAEAREALQRWVRNPTAAVALTLQQVHDRWWETACAGLKPATVESYDCSWKRIEKLQGGAFIRRPIRGLTADDLRRAVLELAESYSKGTAQVTRTVLTMVFRYAAENQLVDRNNMEYVRLRQQPGSPPKRRPFSREEFQILRDRWASVPGGDAVLAMCYLGFRISEFCALSVEDYNPVYKTLRGGGKTAAGTGRIVPVHRDIQPIVERWVSAGPGPLYRTPAGQRYSVGAFRRGVWYMAIDALGLPRDLVPHSARHTCATRLAASGARQEDIQKIIGHTSYDLTAAVYINQDVETLCAAMDLVD